MENRDGLDFLCKDKFDSKYFKDKEVGHKFIWCDQCYNSFQSFKNTVFDNHKIILKEIDSYKHVVQIVENQYSIIEKVDEENVRQLPPVVFNTNNLGW